MQLICLNVQCSLWVESSHSEGVIIAESNDYVEGLLSTLAPTTPMCIIIYIDATYMSVTQQVSVNARIKIC